MTRWRRPGQILAAALLCHVVAGFGLRTLQWTSDLQDRFLPDDPAVADLRRAQHLFGSEESLFLLVESDAPVDLRTMFPRMEVWRTELASIPGVARVVGLGQIPTTVWDTPTSWRIVPLGSLPDPAAAALHHPLARKTLLRPDGKGVALLVMLDAARSTKLEDRVGLNRRLHRWAVRRPEPFRFEFAGTLPFHIAAIHAAYHDVRVICPPLLVAIFALLGLSFGSLRCAAIVVGVAALNILSTFGIAAWAGTRISQFSLIVIPIVFTVGLLDNVHLTYGYCRQRRGGEERERALRSTMATLLRPCLWTSLTTIAGFAALLLSSVPQIEQLGALAAVGTAWAFASSFTVLPWLLQAVDPSRPAASSARRTYLRRPRRPMATIVAAGVFVVAATPGLARLSIVADFPRLFGPAHPITTQFERIEDAWGGVADVSFLLSARQPEVYDDPEALQRLATFVGLLRTRELVTSVTSPLDLLADASRSYRVSFGRSPDPAEIRLALGRAVRDARGRDRGSPLAQLVGSDGRTFRIDARVRMMQPERFPALAADLYGLRKDLLDLFEVHLTGWPLVYKNLEHTLLRELVESFVAAFAAVALLLLVAFRSLRWWLLSLIPNIVPLWLVLGALGWSGAGFSTGLILAPGIALGLVVDDTIHLLYAVREQMAHADSLETGIDRALACVGPALATTSAVLVVGFGMLLLSSFRGNQLLAMVMVAVAALAWLADIVLLPALLVVFGSSGRVRAH